jgi:hypothetical protein
MRETSQQQRAGCATKELNNAKEKRSAPVGGYRFVAKNPNAYYAGRTFAPKYTRGYLLIILFTEPCLAVHYFQLIDPLLYNE